MTEERKVAKKQRVDDADDAVDAAVLSAMEQVQKRLDQLSLKRQGARPAIQNMIATDMWIKVLPFLCMSDAVSAYQGGFLHVPRPWQMTLNDTLVMDYKFLSKYQWRIPELLEFWQHSKIGANIRVWIMDSALSNLIERMHDWIDCFPRVERVVLGMPLFSATFAHLIESTAATLRRLDVWVVLGDECVGALIDARPAWTELRMRLDHGMYAPFAEALPKTLTLLHKSGTYMPRDSMANILTRCPLLTDLRVPGSGDVQGRMRTDIQGVFAATSNGRAWTAVELHDTYVIGDADLATFGGASLQRLSMSLRDCSPTGLQKCLDASPALEYLSLINITEDDKARVMASITGSRAALSLRDLFINNNSARSGSEKDAMAMYRHLPRMPRVAFYDMSTEHVRELVALYSDAKRRNVLEELIVSSKLVPVPDDLRGVIANSNRWTEIEIRRMDWEYDLDRKSMAWLVTECKALTSLEVGRCDIAPETALQLLRRPWKKLSLGPPVDSKLPNTDNIRIEDLRRLQVDDATIDLHAFVLTGVTAKELDSLEGRGGALSLLLPRKVATEYGTYGRTLSRLYPASPHADADIIVFQRG